MARKRKDDLGTPQLGGSLDIKMNEMAGVKGFGGGPTRSRSTSSFEKKVKAHVQKGKDLKARRETFGSHMNEATFKVSSSDPKIAAEGKATLKKRFAKRNKVAKLRLEQSKSQPGGDKAPRPLDLWEKSSPSQKKALIKVAKQEGVLSRKTLPANSKRAVKQPRPAKANVTPSGLEGIPKSSKKSPTRLDVHKETNYPAMTKVVRDIKKANDSNPYKKKSEKESSGSYESQKYKPDMFDTKTSEKMVTKYLKKKGMTSKQLKKLTSGPASQYSGSFLIK